jgi:hypothetical protein
MGNQTNGHCWPTVTYHLIGVLTRGGVFVADGPLLTLIFSPIAALLRHQSDRLTTLLK